MLHLAKQDCMAKVQVGRGWIEPGFYAKRTTFGSGCLKTGPQIFFADEFGQALLKKRDLLINGYCGQFTIVLALHLSQRSFEVSLMRFPLCVSAALVCLSASAQTVRFDTNLGNIDVQLLPNSAPNTVQNFLNYVNKGAYNNSLFHRSVSGFVIQGGGFTWADGTAKSIPQDKPIKNEFNVSNTRGTLAMAKLGGDPDSATNQWFFNTANNASNLNFNNGGFTVFGRITTAASLAVMDNIAARQTINATTQLGAAFDTLPVIGYGGGNVTDANLILVRSITVLDSGPTIASGGVATAGAYGGFSSAAPGSFLEIYGSNLAGSTSRLWTEADFTDGKAPTTLDGVSVTVDGKPAYVYYISSGQVNVQVPGDVSVGGPVQVVVSYSGKSSSAASILMTPIAGGILSPSTFLVSGKQYAAAVHSNGTFTSNGSVPNVPAAPAIPGETLVFYGLGFGGVTPAVAAGQVATGPDVACDSGAILLRRSQCAR